MGWTFSQEWETKEQMIDYCLRACSEWNPFAHSVSGNNLWVVFERKSDAPASYEREGREPYVYPNRFIALFLLQGGRGDGWGYKDMDESCGPCEMDCPLRYLDMVPDPGSYATEWRQKVREFHKGKANKRVLIAGIRVGMRLKLTDGCRPKYITVRSTKPLIGESDEGGRYKIQPRHIESIQDMGSFA